jgi:hypothetical protein
MVMFVCSVSLDVGGAGEARGALQRPDPHQHDPLPHQHQAHRVGLPITNGVHPDGSAFVWLSWIRIRIGMAVLDPDPHWFGCPGSGSALVWLSWIRILISLAVLDPDPH